MNILEQQSINILGMKLKKKIKKDFNREFSREEILNSIDLAIRRGAETEKEVLKEAINFLFS
jgi:hypothetical protein